MEDKKFQAVIIGSEISAYAMAREINDEYGIKPIVLSRFVPTVLKNSEIITPYYADTTTDDKLIEALLKLGKEQKAAHPNQKLFLLANSDHLIVLLAEKRESLETYYLVPVPDMRTIEKVADKESFENFAMEVGMKVPQSFYVDFSQVIKEELEKQLPPDHFTYPVIAKPANSAEYDQLRLSKGFQKVYVIQNATELKALWQALFDADFRDKFIVQKMVQGDETSLYSITAFVNSQGELALLSSAHVLLQEHAPAMLGIPCSMITASYPELYAQVRRFFAELKKQGYHYHGFANFDVKRDANSGEFYFFEVNPRIGRNHFYIYGAGVNAMKLLIADIIEEKSLPEVIADKEILYTIIPKHLLLRYIEDKALREKVSSLYRNGQVVNPTLNPNDKKLKRQIYQYLSMIKQIKKFKTYYPKVTKSGF